MTHAMTDITKLTDAQLEKQIKLHFATGNAIEAAECHLRACPALLNGYDTLAQLTLLNVEIGNVLRDLITERNYRERACKRIA